MHNSARSENMMHNENHGEADVEQAALDWLSALGWQVAHGPGIAPDTPNTELTDYGQMVLERRLRDALAGCHGWCQGRLG